MIGIEILVKIQKEILFGNWNQPHMWDCHPHTASRVYASLLASYARGYFAPYGLIFSQFEFFSSYKSLSKVFKMSFADF